MSDTNEHHDEHFEEAKELGKHADGEEHPDTQAAKSDTAEEYKSSKADKSKSDRAEAGGKPANPEEPKSKAEDVKSEAGAKPGSEEEKPDKSDKPEKPDKQEKSDKPEKVDKPEKSDKLAKPADKADKSDKPEKADKPAEEGAATSAKSDADAEAVKSKAPADEQPKSSADAPKSSTDAPKSSTDAPKSSAEAPKSTADAPKSNADAPKSNADAPKSTADAAKSTTADAPKSATSDVASSTADDAPKPKAKSLIEAVKSATKSAAKSEVVPSKSKLGSSADAAGGSKTKVQSGVAPSKSKLKSDVAGAAGSKVKSELKATKSGVNATKSNLKSEVMAAKSKLKNGSASKVKSEVKATKSQASQKRHASATGASRVESKASSSSKSGSRSKVADVTCARIGFVGAGRMTESIVKGLLKSEKVKPKQVFVAAKTSKNLDNFKVQGISTTTRAYDIFGKFDCDLIFMAVHGFVVRNCFKMGGTRPLALTTNFIPSRKRPTYILSLIGGVSLGDLKACLLNPESENRYKVEMHRIMLNTSVAYGLGVGALDVEIDSKKCSPLIRDLLHSLAKIEHVSADLMDAVCSVVGNGSAFVYYYISALADGGVKMGLNKGMATKLATKTMQCAALTMLETNKGPSELRDEFTSPSGGAIYGLHVLDKQDCSSGIQAAIDASYRRLKELVDVAN